MLGKYSPGCTAMFGYHSATENAPCSLSSGAKCIWHAGGKLLAITPCKLRQALEPAVYHSHSTFGCQQWSDLALHLTDSSRLVSPLSHVFIKSPGAHDRVWRLCYLFSSSLFAVLTAGVTAVFEILAPEVVAPFLLCALTMWIRAIASALLLAVTASIPKFAYALEILLFKQW